MTRNCNHYLQVKEKKYTLIHRIMEVRKTLSVGKKKEIQKLERNKNLSCKPNNKRVMFVRL